ncbi:hypothetical protein F5878DRAFT_633205 [Lentinula raphanica]|uniref:C3H1-type domain-containing protein n=1 Tax=Lentinula raphanica TaxID=153919 RepID=A0AA38UCA6_9AGAR|nr:hypothetical protein F5878DRAFT_633205 [Lentinula raphanica]
MSTNKIQPQIAADSAYLPALPTGPWSLESAQATVKALEAIVKRVTDGDIDSVVGRRVLSKYLDSVFSLYKLYHRHNLDDSLKPWFEKIDDHQRHVVRAEQDSNREGRRHHLPGAKTQVFLGPATHQNGQRAKTSIQLAPRVDSLARSPFELAHISDGALAPREGEINEPFRPLTSLAFTGSATPLPALPKRFVNLAPLNLRDRIDLPQTADRKAMGMNTGSSRVRAHDTIMKMGLAGSKGRTRDGDTSSEDDEHDRYGVLRPSKRRKQDPTQFGWAADAFFRRMSLSKKHREVIAAIDNYKRDINAAIESIENSGVNPLFPGRLWGSVLRDEYIELSEVLATVTFSADTLSPFSYSNPFTEALATTTLAKPVPTKEITDESTWYRAWSATAEAITFAFPSRSNEVQAYGRHILALFEATRPEFHGNVIRYDRAMRQFIGSRRDILFDEFKHRDLEMFDMMYLWSSGIHYQVQPPSGSVLNSDVSQVEKRARKQENEICRNFNQGACHADSGCKRRHVCSTCGEAGHGTKNCDKKHG